jgi:hypothetical protein
MSAIRRVLVPIDFSDTSARVLELARVLADAVGAQEPTPIPVAARTA